MAGERVFAARNAKHPTSAIAGVTHARIVRSTTEKVDPGGAGATGRRSSAITAHGRVVELYGTDYEALLSLIGVKANCVIGTTGADGALEKVTIKNVRFAEVISAIDIPAKDSGGKLAPFGIRGVACGESSDTPATMEVWTTDA